jgi:hypothetical protein
MIIIENDKRQKELRKLETETAQSNLGDEMSTITSALDKFREELVEQRRMVGGLTTFI